MALTDARYENPPHTKRACAMWDRGVSKTIARHVDRPDRTGSGMRDKDDTRSWLALHAQAALRRLALSAYLSKKRVTLVVGH